MHRSIHLHSFLVHFSSSLYLNLNLTFLFNLFLDGCANNCNGQGQCIKHNDLWQCECNPSASGEFCEIPIETDCSDKLDNDNGEFF